VCLGYLGPGDALFLYTDGAQDVRDARGRFFPLPTVLTSVVRESLAPQAVLSSVHSALVDHTNGNPTDDIALLVLRNDRCMPPGARETARPATTHAQPTTHL
jgi:serine phosphatase RsbU (regulator of sigma subunit)